MEETLTAKMCMSSSRLKFEVELKNKVLEVAEQVRAFVRMIAQNAGFQLVDNPKLHVVCKSMRVWVDDSELKLIWDQRILLLKKGELHNCLQSEFQATVKNMLINEEFTIESETENETVFVLSLF